MYSRHQSLCKFVSKHLGQHHQPAHRAGVIARPQRASTPLGNTFHPVSLYIRSWNQVSCSWDVLCGILQVPHYPLILNLKRPMIQKIITLIATPKWCIHIHSSVLWVRQTPRRNAQGSGLSRFRLQCSSRHWGGPLLPRRCLEMSTLPRLWSKALGWVQWSSVHTDYKGN